MAAGSLNAAVFSKLYLVDEVLLGMIQGQNQEVEGEQHQEVLAFALQGQK